MNGSIPDADERTITVDREAGYRAYLVMSWLLVLDMAMHGLAPAWIDWRGFPVDVLAILMAGASTHLWHANRQGILSRRRAMLVALAAAAACGIGAAIALACAR